MNEDGTWAQLGEDIEGEALGDQCGSSVSLSSDGKSVAIGANGNSEGNKVGAGHVRIYKVIENGGSRSLKQLGQDINGEAIADNSGSSVALSADGTRVAIGAVGNDGDGEDSGHVRIYQYGFDFDEWKQIGYDIDGESPGDWSGSSVSMSSDGKMVAVGSPDNSDNGDFSGKVKVYRLTILYTWVQIGQDLMGLEGDYAGWSISLSSDGKTLAIGAPGNSYENSLGRVRMYRLIGSGDSASWSQIGEVVGSNDLDYAGISVSLSSDGKAIAVGSYGNSDNGYMSGHVRVFGVHEDSGEAVVATPPCLNTLNYLDIYGGTCDEYELPGNEAWCRAYGNDGEAGLTPNENCCVCSKLVEK